MGSEVCALASGRHVSDENVIVAANVRMMVRVFIGITV
jgi:hypothetical protein